MHTQIRSGRKPRTFVCHDILLSHNDDQNAILQLSNSKLRALAKLMKQDKYCSLVDNRRAFEYAWEAASAKTEMFAKTAKNPLIAPHLLLIKRAEDPGCEAGL